MPCVIILPAILEPHHVPVQMDSSYDEAISFLQLPATSEGYGLLLCQDSDGARWTIVTTDMSGLKAFIAVWSEGIHSNYYPLNALIVATLAGWPWAHPTSAASLPAIHDPD